MMDEFLFRGLSAEDREALAQRAKRHGRSLEEEVLHVLRSAAEATPSGLGSRMAARFRGAGLSSDLPELRARVVSPTDFAE